MFFLFLTIVVCVRASLKGVNESHRGLRTSLPSADKAWLWGTVPFQLKPPSDQYLPSLNFMYCFSNRLFYIPRSQIIYVFVDFLCWFVFEIMSIFKTLCSLQILSVKDSKQ